MNYRIENTSTNNQAAYLRDATRPWVVIAERSWNSVMGRYTSEAGARAAVRRLKQKEVK